MSDLLDAIPDEDAVRRRLAELANERDVLRQLLRAAREKREAEQRLAEQRRLAGAAS